MELNATRQTGIQTPPAPIAPQALPEPASTEAPALSTPHSSETNELKPQDVPLLLSQSALAQGQSLAELPLIESVQAAQNEQAITAMIEPEAAYQPRAILPEEVQKVLDAYNTEVRQAIDQAPEGSRLARFETSLRLLAGLQEPKLQQDSQAWDVLQMRRSQIESEHQRLMQTPEVQQAFDQARSSALGKIFGAELKQRAGQQAAYLLSEAFQQELSKLPENEVQSRVQQELSALAILDPKRADTIASELIERTVAHQALKSLQSNGENGAQTREGVSQALGVYLKAQQSAVGVSVQATNLSRLTHLPDEQIKQLTDAVAELAKDIKVNDHQQLANSLLQRVDDLPQELRQDASTLIRHMQAQRILGTVLLAGSIAGLMRTELPKDPKSWVSLGTSVVSTASMSHHAFRLAGLERTANLVAKMNTPAMVNGVKIPVVGSLLTGINITMDSMAFYKEYQNEDRIGMTSRAMGVGAGIASIAAATVMSGPAAPITLIGSTVVGLAAWGIDTVWGESDLTGQIRQDLRKLGISERERETLNRFEAGQPVEQATQPERVALINALMDQNTNRREETLIYNALMTASDQDFVDLLTPLHTGRIVAELEDPQQLRGFLERVAKLTPAGPDTPKLLGPMLKGLAAEKRSEELMHFLDKAPDHLKRTIPPAALQNMIDQLLKGWTGHNEEKAVVALLADDGLRQPREGMLKLGGEKLLLKLRRELSESATATLLASMITSADADTRALAAKLYQRPAGYRVSQLTPQTQLGSNQAAGRLTLAVLQNLNEAQIRALDPELKGRLVQLLGLAPEHQAFVSLLK